MSFWCLYCWLWTYFTHCSVVSIFDFEQEYDDWEGTARISFRCNSIIIFLILKHRWDDIREVIWQTLLHTVCCIFPMIEWDWALTNVVSFWTQKKTYSTIRYLQCNKFKVWKAARHQTNNESKFVDQFEVFCGKASENCDHFWDYSKYSHEGIFEISI